jgi:hypothetical protein
MIRFQIHIAGTTRTIGVRNSRKLCVMYVTGASWGNGAAPSKITWNADIAKVTTFSKTAAEAIVKAYPNRQMTIVPVEVA